MHGYSWCQYWSSIPTSCCCIASRSVQNLYTASPLCSIHALESAIYQSWLPRCSQQRTIVTESNRNSRQLFQVLKSYRKVSPQGKVDPPPGTMTAFHEHQLISSRLGLSECACRQAPAAARTCQLAHMQRQKLAPRGWPPSTNASVPASVNIPPAFTRRSLRHTSAVAAPH